MPQMGMMDPAQMQAMMMGMMNGMPGMNGMNGAQNGMNGMNGMNGAKPLNPRHFDRFEGGRKRFSDTFLLTKTVVHACRGAQPLFHALFWRQNTV